MAQDALNGGVPICYFRTYSTAALKAAKLGLLSNTAALKVLDAVEEDMKADPINIAPGSVNEKLLREETLYARTLLSSPRGLLASISPLRSNRRFNFFRWAKGQSRLLVNSRHRK